MGAGIEVPAGRRVVDVSGRHVYPSLFPAATELGLVEISSVRATVDTTELGEINPQARADFAMNFDSELLPVARSAGILIAGVTPIGGIVSGSLAAMKLDGWTREDATLKAPAAIVVRWPDLAIDRSPTARRSVRAQEKRRDEALETLKNVFAEARAYAKARNAEGTDGHPAPRRRSPGSKRSCPRSTGRCPSSSSPTVAQIRGGARLGEGRRACGSRSWAARTRWRVPDELAQAHVPVIVDAVLDLPPRADDPYDAHFASAGILAKAGVRVAFNDGSSASGAAPSQPPAPGRGGRRLRLPARTAPSKR